MAQLGQKAHGFKDLDFLIVLGIAAVVLGAYVSLARESTVCFQRTVSG